MGLDIFRSTVNLNICNAGSFYIYRNGTPFGPYYPKAICDMASSGKILLCDKIATTNSARNDDEFETVGNMLRVKGLKVNVESAGSLATQLQKVGRDLLFPKELLSKSTWTNDSRLLLLTVIGMFPLISASVIPSDFLRFYALSLYFASIWAMFFYSYYKTKQVKRNTTLKIFFITQAVMLLVWNIFGLNDLNIFYKFTESSDIFSNLIGYIFGVGVTEEFAKMLVLILLLRKAKEPMIPKTMVFYGLISGLAFGVFEGVEYQLLVNSKASYEEAYYLNIARITTLPFIHAIWTALAGFFLSFANLYPRYRKALYFLAIFIPATAHGLYDTLCSYLPILAFAICILGVGLLNHYLGDSKNYQMRLK